MTCAPCEYTAEHGWWGDSKLSHCRDCHQSWRRQTNASHCVRCHVTFNSPSTSARHDIAEGIGCMSPATLAHEPRINEWGDAVWWPSVNGEWASTKPTPITRGRRTA